MHFTACLVAGVTTLVLAAPSVRADTYSTCYNQCKEAGHFCNDPYAAGSNQQISCSQACSAILDGHATYEQCAATCIALDQLHAGDETLCSIDIGSKNFDLCGVCAEWDATNGTPFRVERSRNPCQRGCNIGAGHPIEPVTTLPVPVPPASATYTKCFNECKEAGHYCNDPYAAGSNQQISCSQACSAILDGHATHEQCAATCDAVDAMHARGETVCNIDIGAKRFHLCGDCAEWDAAHDMPFRVERSRNPCQRGCDIGAGHPIVTADASGTTTVDASSTVTLTAGSSSVGSVGGDDDDDHSFLIIIGASVAGIVVLALLCWCGYRQKTNNSGGAGGDVTADDVTKPNMSVAAVKYAIHDDADVEGGEPDVASATGIMTADV